jgi:hypothetical protein
VKNQSHSADPFNDMTCTNIGRMNLGNLGHDNCIEDKIIKRPALSIPSDHGSLPPIFSIILTSSHLILFHPFFSSLFSPSLILIHPIFSSLFILLILIRRVFSYLLSFLLRLFLAISSFFVTSNHHLFILPCLFSSSHPYLSVLLILFCPILSSLFFRSFHYNLSHLLILICFPFFSS